MGVIDIRRRTETPNTIGNLPRLNIQTPHVFSNPMVGQDYAAKARLGNTIASSAARIGDAVVNFAAAIQMKEDKRMVDGALAEGTKNLNDMMYSTGQDGAPVGLMVDAEDVNKGGTALPEFDRRYEEMLENLRTSKGLNDRQFEMVKQGLGGRAEGWRVQMINRVGDTYAKSEEQNADKRATQDFSTLVAKPVLDEADWQILQQDLADPSYLRGKRIVGKEAAKANVQNVVLQADLARKNAWMKETMAGAENFKTEQEVKDYFAAKREVLKTHKFITDGMSSVLTKEQRENAAKALQDDLKVAEDKAKKIAKANAVEAQESARDKFYQREPEINQQKSPALRAVALREQAQEFKDSDPRFYNMIMAKADLQDMKAETAAARKQVQDLKAQTAAERKQRADDKHDVMAMATFYLIQPRDLSDQARKDWLRQRREFECEYLEMFKKGEIDPETAKTVNTMMSTHYSKEEAWAIADFDAKFGFDRGAFEDQAAVGRELKIRKEADGTPTKVTVSIGDKSTDISYEDLQKYRNKFLKELRSMPQGADKVGWANRCADRIISDAVKDNAPRIISGIDKMSRWTRVAESQRRDAAQKAVADLYRRKAQQAKPAAASVIPDIDDDPEEDYPEIPTL